MKLNKGEVMVLRTVPQDLKTCNGFKWKKKGIVKCNDWNEKPVCGNGLHGLLKGEGDGSLLNWLPDVFWYVLAVKKYVQIGDNKVKFPSCRILYCGDRKTATNIIYEKYHTKVVGLIISAGDYGQATAGYFGQATAGYFGQATAGYSGQATAGDFGQATAGDSGQATAGDYGQATAGDYGQATAGDGGIIIIRYSYKGFKFLVGKIGKDGLKPNTKYKVNKKFEFEEVK